MSTPGQALLTNAFGTDIAHMGGDLVVTPGGDIATITGLANVKLALFHRLMTVPGTLIHRPTYGVGIMQYENSLSSFSIQQKLAALIQEQFALDPRVQQVSSVSISSEDDTPQTTIIRVFVTLVGYSEQQMVFTPFSGAMG